MTNDIELLRRYVETGSEAAFAELVRRHIDFVYAAAVRQANGAHRAEDVAQAVFTDLARKARTLCGRADLVGWLYLSTRYAARSVVRSEVRREAREKEAHMIHELTGDNGPHLDWATLRPMLDEALHDLAEADRTAILRRFFRNDSLAEVARALGVSEEAARKRVDRALDKLHALLARRGVTSTASALALALAHQPVIAAPAGLAAAVTGGALTHATTVGGEAVTAGALIEFMSTSKIVVGTACLVAAVVGGIVLFGRDRTELIEADMASGPSALARVTKERDALRSKIVQLAVTAASPQTTVTAASPAAAGQVKAMEGNLRQIAAARLQFQLENGRWPASMADLVGPDKLIKTLVPAAGERYSTLSLTGHSFQPLQVVSPTGLVANYDPNGDPQVIGSAAHDPGPLSPGDEMMRRSSDIARRLDPSISRRAMNAYQAAHEGKRPTGNPRALVGYFESAKDGADYLEYVELWETARRMLETEAQATGQRK